MAFSWNGKGRVALKGLGIGTLSLLLSTLAVEAQTAEGKDPVAATEVSGQMATDVAPAPSEAVTSAPETTEKPVVEPSDATPTMADPAATAPSSAATTMPEHPAAESASGVASEPAAAEAPAKEAAPEAVKAPETPSAPETAEAPKMPDAPEAATETKAEAATETKPEVKDVSAPAVMPTAPAPETECDRLAAHPFDPDAVATGVFYADLDAAKVVEACQAAITDYPQEARFFTQLARGLHKAGKPSLVYAASKQGAELGSGQSMAYLGVLYKNGTSVPESQPEALAWFDKAAAAGNPGGMVFAAAMYRDGVGTDRNYERAAELYRKASDLDVAEASADLGIFYDRGQGVERNPEQAASLLLKAFAADDKDTQRIFFEVPGVLSEATRKAVQTELKAKGFYKSSIDADFGSGTRNALILFKRSAQK
ncbi:hypothetical protein [uncultured Cohaesibacter sp.]|uniref:hypothetical protein n=1 Tax=uncultured Cohaesibacter sp. TaxID=1002546 RepID=UPI0029C8A1CA|nr:hypothetical protein [uncultured Cohaesibacter sp.]